MTVSPTVPGRRPEVEPCRRAGLRRSPRIGRSVVHDMGQRRSPRTRRSARRVAPAAQLSREPAPRLPSAGGGGRAPGRAARSLERDLAPLGSLPPGGARPAKEESSRGTDIERAPIEQHMPAMTASAERQVSRRGSARPASRPSPPRPRRRSPGPLPPAALGKRRGPRSLRDRPVGRPPTGLARQTGKFLFAQPAHAEAFAARHGAVARLHAVAVMGLPETSFSAHLGG